MAPVVGQVSPESVSWWEAAVNDDPDRAVPMQSGHHSAYMLLVLSGMSLTERRVEKL